MLCYVLAMGKQHLGPHVVVGYGIKIVWPGLFITSPDHLDGLVPQTIPATPPPSKSRDPRKVPNKEALRIATSDLT